MEVSQQPRYLQYQPEVWTGVGHQMYNLYVLLAEAAILQRIAVLPDLTLAAHHNHGKALRVPLSAYFDLSVFQTEVCFITQEEFKQLKPLDRELVDEKTPTQKIKEKTTSLIVRKFTRSDGVFSAPINSDRAVEKIACKMRKLITPTQSIKRQAEEIINFLGGDFDVVHVRRTDLLEQAKREWWKFPRYAQRTSPKGVRQRIAQWVEQGRTLYVMTDEPEAGFFDPLKTWYKVYTFRDFWQLEEIHQTDNYLLYEIEQCIASQARIYVKMFASPVTDKDINFTYSLLSYPRPGVNTRFSRTIDGLMKLSSYYKEIVKKFVKKTVKKLVANA